MTNSSTTGKNRRFSLIRLFNANNPKSGLDTDPVPAVPAHYRHSMAPSMDVQSELLRERRKSIAAVTDSNIRSLSLDLPSGTKAAPAEMTDKMRQFDELLQKRRGSTIRISLTPSLLQESS